MSSADANIRILLVEDDPEDREIVEDPAGGLDEFGGAFLPKPFTAQELMATIYRALDG